MVVNMHVAQSACTLSTLGPPHSPPAAVGGEMVAEGDHVGQVWEHDSKVDQEAFLGKDRRKRLADLPPEESKQELRCIYAYPNYVDHLFRTLL